MSSLSFAILLYSRFSLIARTWPLDYYQNDPGSIPACAPEGAVLYELDIFGRGGPPTLDVASNKLQFPSADIVLNAGSTSQTSELAALWGDAVLMEEEGKGETEVKLHVLIFFSCCFV